MHVTIIQIVENVKRKKEREQIMISYAEDFQIVNGWYSYKKKMNNTTNLTQSPNRGLNARYTTWILERHVSVFKKLILKPINYYITDNHDFANITHAKLLLSKF